RRRHTRFSRDWSSDVCSSDLGPVPFGPGRGPIGPAPWRAPWHILERRGQRNTGTRRRGGVMSGPVVVGVDGSESSLAAVEAAAAEAERRGVGLRVVHAFLWPALHVPLGAPPMGPADGGLQAAADRLVAEAVEHARSAAPNVEVSHAVITGEPLTVLEAQSRQAELVVVG